MGTFSAYAFAIGLAAMGQDVFSSRQATTQLEDVVVEGRALDDAARDFARTVGDTPPLGALPGRWTKPLCISAANLKAPFGQQMIDGIAMTAVDVGLEVAGPGCATNVLIVGTDNGPRTANSLVEGARRRFRSKVDHAQHSFAALARFRESDAAVRWWHISVPRIRDTGDFAGRGGGDEAPGMLGTSGGGLPVISIGGASSIIAPTVRYDVEAVTVVVDFSKTEAVTMSALTDYVAMVVLAQVDPQADFRGQSSILNLFNQPATDGLTDWDQDYLRAVYTVDLSRNTPASHEGMIARRLANLQRERQLNDVGADDSN